MKMPRFPVHTDNKPVMRLDFAAQSWLYIGKLWAHRRQRRVRDIIRAHCDMIRRWRAGQPGSLGMSATGRDPCCGDGGMV